jgi:N6-L-threonylcarbamoyladenine synthase
MLELSLGSVDETSELGAQLAEVVRQGDVIFLLGELGAGKTALSRGFLRRFFGDSELEVPSPSYLICLSYTDEEGASVRDAPAPESSVGAPVDADADAGSPAPGAGRVLRTGGCARIPGMRVLHIDPYRLPQGKVAALIDLPTAFRQDICLIEWPQRLGPELCTPETPERLEVSLSGVGPQAIGRSVTIRAVGPRWAPLVTSWEAAGRVTVELPEILPPPSDVSPPPVDGATVSAAGAESRRQACAAVSGVAPREMLVLGIESSCDDTGATVVRGDGLVLGECLASQAGVHEQWGGVVPRLAQEAHRAAIDATVDEALRRAGVAPSSLSAIAVTVGPGLSLCLEVGVRKALCLCRDHQLPLVRVHHMEAHALVTWLPSTEPAQSPAAAGQEPPLLPPPLRPGGQPPFPFLTLLVSGGHNMLVLTRGVGQHTVLGATLDDSIGEAFDKTARLLGIDAIPGGPPLERLAAGGDASAHTLPKPLSRTKDDRLRFSCDFSYAGLKSAVRALIEPQQPTKKQRKAAARAAAQAAEAAATDASGVGRVAGDTGDSEGGAVGDTGDGNGAEEAEPASEEVAPGSAAAAGEDRRRADIAAAFQRAAVEHLIERTERAIVWAREAEPSLSCVVAAGGVAANGEVRRQLGLACRRAGLPLVCPPVRLCTDNGTMVAWTGMLRLWLGLAEPPLRESDEVQLFVEVRPKWPIGPRDPRSTTQAQQLARRRKSGQANGGAGWLEPTRDGVPQASKTPSKKRRQADT